MQGPIVWNTEEEQSFLPPSENEKNEKNSNSSRDIDGSDESDDEIQTLQNGASCSNAKKNVRIVVGGHEYDLIGEGSLDDDYPKRDFDNISEESGLYQKKTKDHLLSDDVDSKASSSFIDSPTFTKNQNRAYANKSILNKRRFKQNSNRHFSLRKSFYSFKNRNHPSENISHSSTNKHTSLSNRPSYTHEQHQIASKSEKKLVRVASVVAYVVGVFLAAVCLAVYYTFAWKSNYHSANRTESVNTTHRTHPLSIT